MSKKKTTGGNLGGQILYAFLQLLGLLPAWWHYGWSWGLSYLLQYIVGYRRKVVQAQLRIAFPEKDKSDLCKIERDYYRHLSDLMVEIVMMTAFTETRFSKHITITNPELLAELHRDNRTVFYLLGHYGNWEWFTGCQCLLPITQFNVIYKHQSGLWHYVMSRLRQKFGSRLIEKYDASRQIIEERHDDINRTYIFVADQSPAYTKADLFVHFLHQPTATLTGAERLARLRGAAVVYIEAVREKRGVYRLSMVEMTRNASLLPKYQISTDFMHLLESSIRRQPELWLWSHRRWKVTTQQVHEAFPDKKIIYR